MRCHGAPFHQGVPNNPAVDLKTFKQSSRTRLESFHCFNVAFASDNFPCAVQVNERLNFAHTGIQGSYRIVLPSLFYCIQHYQPKQFRISSQVPRRISNEVCILDWQSCLADRIVYHKPSSEICHPLCHANYNSSLLSGSRGSVAMLPTITVNNLCFVGDRDITFRLDSSLVPVWTLGGSVEWHWRTVSLSGAPRPTRFDDCLENYPPASPRSFPSFYLSLLFLLSAGGG